VRQLFLRIARHLAGEEFGYIQVEREADWAADSGCDDITCGYISEHSAKLSQGCQLAAFSSNFRRNFSTHENDNIGSKSHSNLSGIEAFQLSHLHLSPERA
jgi:hypothetical protein